MCCKFIEVNSKENRCKCCNDRLNVFSITGRGRGCCFVVVVVVVVVVFVFAGSLFLALKWRVLVV